LRAPFPIQLGLDHVTDPPSETADFEALMTAAQASGIGWLWWDWYNPYGSDNNLSDDGTASNVTAIGRTVVRGHAASIQRTAQRACRSPGPDSPTLPPPRPEPNPVQRRVAINAGGGALPGFVADDPFSGANVSGGRQPRPSRAAIDRSLLPAPAPPESLYQSVREGAAMYRITGFDAGALPIVQLHFAELEFSQIGSRRFDVYINDDLVLADYDIVERAGGAHRALQENFAARPNAEGEIVIRLQAGWAGEPCVNGIVVTEWPAAWR
jgi:hypothetical protein